MNIKFLESGAFDLLSTATLLLGTYQAIVVEHGTWHERCAGLFIVVGTVILSAFKKLEV